MCIRYHFMFAGSMYAPYTNKAVLEPRVLPAFAFTYFCNHCNIRFDLIPVKVICANLLKDHYVQVPWKHIKVCGYGNFFFFKNLNEKCHWPLDDLWPQVCWGHMCDSTQGSLCPSLTHENTSKYVDTVTFSKTWTKGHWPLDDLWPHICWRHMCDSTQGSLCPSPMGIHQCMWIQWSILQNTTYILHIYILHTDGTYLDEA